MDIKRIGLALGAALVVAAAVSFVLLARIRAERASRPQFAKIVAAGKAMAAGSPLTADSLIVIDWPASVKLPGSFTKPEEVIGRSVIYPVGQNQPIMDFDLAVPGSGIGLTVKIPEGMRAVSVRSNDVVGVAGFLYPGSRVDVLITSQSPTGPMTRIVLQNVEVLTAGQRIQPDPTGKPETVNVVTLLLNPEDGERLVLATSHGSIQFLLRNGADQNTARTKPVGVTELLAGTSTKADAPPVQRVVAAAKVKPADFYEVETITPGGKRTVEKFNQAGKETQ